MANAVLLNVLIQDLISPNEASQKQASQLLRLLTQANVDHRTFLAKNAAAIKALIHKISPESYGNSEQIAIAEHSVAILFHLLLNEELIYDLGLLGIVKPITQNVIRASRPIPVRENAAGALLCLSKLDAHKAPIGIYGGIAGLLSLITSCSERGKQDALKTLIHLLVYDGNKTLAARGGAAPLLLDMLIDSTASHSHSDQQASELALSVLKIMASHPEGVSAIAAASGVKRIANAITDMTSGTIKEKAALALLRIFKTEPSLAGHLEKERGDHDHALYSCLHELSIHGSRKGRRAATSLLKLFMDMEVGDHSHQHNLELAKEHDEQDEEDGEELAQARVDGPSNYGELCYNNYPILSAQEKIVDVDDDDDEEDNDDDDEDDDDYDDDDALDIIDDDDDDDGDDDDDIHNGSDDAHSVLSSNCIEVPVAY